MNFALQLVVTLLILFLLDAFWLNYLIAELVDWPAVYNFGNTPNWPFAEFWYCLMGTWLTLRYAYPAIQERDAAPALIGGAGLGLVASTVYAAVNQVFFTTWTLELIVMDIIWNTFVFALTGIISCYFGFWLEINYPPVVKNIQRA